MKTDDLAAVERWIEHVREDADNAAHGVPIDGTAAASTYHVCTVLHQHSPAVDLEPVRKFADVLAAYHHGQRTTVSAINAALESALVRVCEIRDRMYADVRHAGQALPNGNSVTTVALLTVTEIRRRFHPAADLASVRRHVAKHPNAQRHGKAWLLNETDAEALRIAARQKDASKTPPAARKPKSREWTCPQCDYSEFALSQRKCPKCLGSTMILAKPIAR